LSGRRIIVLLAVVAALATILAACGGGGSSEDPQTVIENATFEGLESGEVELSMNVKQEGEKPGEVKVELSGPFQTTGKTSLPELAMTASVEGEENGKSVDFEGGLTVLADRAYVTYGDKNYEIDPTTFGFIKAGFEEAAQEGEKESGAAEATACQKAAESIELGELVDDLENEGTEEVAGVETTKLSGDLDSHKTLEAVAKLLESPACSSELEAAGKVPLAQLKAQEGELTGAIKKAHVEIYVGQEDNIPRKVVAEVDIEPKGAGESAELELEMTLSKVDEKQAIKAPAGAASIEKLFEQLGVNPLELFGSRGGGGLGELIEGIASGGSSGNESLDLEGPESPSGGAAKEFKECLAQAESATDVQKCATLME
jgi:hypothetical protein